MYQLNYVPRDGLLRFSGKDVLLYGRIADRPNFSKTGVGWILEVEEVFDNGVLSNSMTGRKFLCAVPGSRKSK